MPYYAHITDDGRKQTVLEHLNETARLSKSLAVEPLKPYAELRKH